MESNELSLSNPCYYCMGNQDSGCAVTCRAYQAYLAAIEQRYLKPKGKWKEGNNACALDGRKAELRRTK